MLVSGQVASHQVVVLLGETKRVWGRTVDAVATLLGKALGVRTCWPLLCCSRAQSLAWVWSETSLTSLVCFVRVGVGTARHGLSASHNVAR